MRSGDRPSRDCPSFAVIVPMFNERANAERAVHEITRALADLPNRTALIVADDGSKDGTGEILSSLRATHPALDVTTHPVNRGYGAALVSGARRASALGFDYALFMDSDLTNDPRDLPRFAEKMSTGADVIKASRFIAGGRMEGVPWRRAIISRAGNLVARWLYRLPINDCTNGFRAVRTPLLMQMDLREKGFPVIAEELYWCRFLAHSFVEVPVILTNADRQSSFRYSPSVLRAYLRYPLRAFFGIRPRAAASAAGSEQ